MHQRKSLVLILVKQRQNSAWACIILVIIVICLLMVKKFKADNVKVNFPTQFYLGSISNKFGAIDSREVSLKGNMYDFSADW